MSAIAIIVHEAIGLPKYVYSPSQYAHSLAHLVTYEQATTLPIGRVVELVVQRYDTEMGNHLKTLYSRVKGQWSYI